MAKRRCGLATGIQVIGEGDGRGTSMFTHHWNKEWCVLKEWLTFGIFATTTSRWQNPLQIQEPFGHPSQSSPLSPTRDQHAKCYSLCKEWKDFQTSQDKWSESSAPTGKGAYSSPMLIVTSTIGLEEVLTICSKCHMLIHIFNLIHM